MIQILYTYDRADGEAPIGDIFPICQNLAWSKKRNAVDTISFSISLRELRDWCRARRFDITRFFTPIRSSVVVTATGGAAILGGFLAATPEFSFGDSADAVAQFSFSGWLGLATGYYLQPVQNFNSPLNAQLVAGLNQALSAANSAGAPWPLSIGSHIDTLATVQNTVDSVKKLADFLTERTDNTTGAGPFDIYFDEAGAFEVWQNYGYDVSASAIISFPDDGQIGGAKTLDFPAWDNYFSDVFLTGSGNGYGDGGAAITSAKRNAATVANTGFYEYATSISDISDQNTLDARATAFLRYTAEPFATPRATIDGDQFRIYDHRYGGNLWVGDTVAVELSANLAELLPIEQFATFRIDSIDATVDGNGRTLATLNLIDPTGGTAIS